MKKWYDAFLTSPGPPRGHGLQVQDPTSKVKLDVRRQRPRWPEGTQQNEGPGLGPVKQAVQEAKPRSGGARGSSTKTSPLPFV